MRFSWGRGAWRLALSVVAATWALPVVHALAAPERLSGDVPDATPDSEGAWAISYGLESIELDGPLQTERTSHNYYKLRYSFSPDVAAAVRYESHSLAGGEGLISPIFGSQDEATALGFDLAVNLLNVPMTQRVVDPVSGAETVPFAAGSSFGMGVGMTRYDMSAASLSQEDLLLRAYLTYSTDLTEDMRAHTYFSTGRISGDTHTGSVNRVAAGLDYNLSGGDRPLVLMANGVLDIYNFRQPTFNTSRISRFDIGLRYRLAEDWYASAGWVTLNDSENDSSGSGIFAGLNFVDEPSPPAPLVEEVPVEEPAPSGPAPAEPPPAAEPVPPPPAEPAPVAEAPPADAAVEPAEQPATETAGSEPVIEEEVLVLPDARADAGSSRTVSDVSSAPASPRMMDIEMPPSPPPAGSETAGRTVSSIEQPQSGPVTPLPADYSIAPPGGGAAADYAQGGRYFYDEERARQNAEYIARMEASAVAWSDKPLDSPENAGLTVPAFPGESGPRHTAADDRMVRPDPSTEHAGLLATRESAISERAALAGNSAAAPISGAAAKLKTYTFGNWAKLRSKT
jgi:hypothetical protein